MTKIDVISGFLGAGKTTFIKKLLEEAVADEKVVLIENEFGEIGIDGGLLKDAGIEITEMNSGCICCSLVGDFGEALKKVLGQAMELLTEREKKVILLYYYEDLTLREISDVLEVTESRISQLHTRALKKMKDRMGKYMGIFSV